ncbi:MAG: extracellular solute-binding protein [Bauldia sp.]
MKEATRSDRFSRRDVLKYASIGGVAIGAGAWLPALPALAKGEIRGATVASMKDPLSAAIEAFQAASPGSSVRMEFGDTDPIVTTTRVQLTSGTAPDLITVWPGGGNALAVRQLVPNNFLVDLSDRPWAKDVPHGFDAVMMVDGKQWFLSMQLSMIGGIVNMRTWEKLGVSQAKTWSEFLDMCQKIKDQGVVPIALGNGTGFVPQLISFALVASNVFGRNPAFAEEMLEGKRTFSDSPWKEALEKYAELNKRGFFNENAQGTSNQEQIDMVATGKAAMMIMVSNQIPGVRKAAGHDDFWQMPIPGTDNPDETRISASPSSGFGVNAAAKDKETALAFLDFMASPEGVSRWANSSGLATVLPGSTGKFDYIYKDMYPLLRDGKSVPHQDNKWPNTRVQQTHTAGVQELLNGTTTVEAVLKQMDEAFVSKS